MPPEKPSLDLLRRLTDRHVVVALVDRGRLTRAGIAAATGISKPTVAESIRRLEGAGVVVDTGDRSTGPGRAGLLYDLAPAAGLALAVGIAPEGVVAEVVDVRGVVVAREALPLRRPARPATVARTLTRAAAAAAAAASAATGSTAAPRLAVVSAADPVDRATGRLVHLPDAPFLVGALDPTEALAPLVDGPVTVGNDVSWSAAAERDAVGQGAAQDFAYLYLGEGLGCAVVADGSVRVGANGLAGEVAHLVVTGPRGGATPFIEVFGQLGLRHDGTTAVDVGLLLDRVGAGAGPARTPRTLPSLARAVGDVVGALVAVADPAEVVLGGPWGAHPVVVAAVAEVVQASRRPVAVRPARVEDAALAGVRRHAVDALRGRLLDGLP